MARILMPDYVFTKYDEITPEFLSRQGIKALLIDIDNTLAPYEQAVPDEKIKAWINSLTENGISPAFISNNDLERVNLFNEEIGILAFAKSGKPFSKNLRIAMDKLGTDESSTATLGDQLLTDALAGNLLGLKTITVPPINDKNNLFFRFKRRIEVGTMRKFVSVHGEQYRQACSFWLDGKFKKKNRK